MINQTIKNSFKIIADTKKRNFWFGYKTVYWIEGAYSRLGPYDNCSEACNDLNKLLEII